MISYLLSKQQNKPKNYESKPLTWTQTIPSQFTPQIKAITHTIITKQSKNHTRFIHNYREEEWTEKP